MKIADANSKTQYACSKTEYSEYSPEISKRGPIPLGPYPTAHANELLAYL